MPDQRKNRGAHPEDDRLFTGEALGLLREASSDLAWLRSRGYADLSAVKLIGDRYGLDRRQREAVRRSCCTQDQKNRRHAHQVGLESIQGSAVWIDGFNLIVTIEAALSRGVLLKCPDGSMRDLASVHGTYRQVSQSKDSLLLIGNALAKFKPACCRWYLDKPVSNSGRLKSLIESVAAENHWLWDVELVPNPDDLLMASGEIVVTADSLILDHVPRWLSLAAHIVETCVTDAWIVDFSEL